MSEESEDTIVAASDSEMQDDGDDAETIAKKSKGFGYVEQDNL